MKNNWIDIEDNLPTKEMDIVVIAEGKCPIKKRIVEIILHGKVSLDDSKKPIFDTDSGICSTSVFNYDVKITRWISKEDFIPEKE